jgi:soluble lytic murein transglycosylase-like protein
LKGIAGYLGTGREPNRHASRSGGILVACWLGLVASGIVPAAAADQPDPAAIGPVAPAPAADPPKQPDSPAAQAAPTGRTALFKAVVRALLAKETANTGLPADVADAVVHVESDYNPATIGGVGEIGLMQIRPETAAMLGFKGNNDELARPEVNIHYGVIYLSKAWRLANGDLCRALMKYRAGHGEETMSPLSVEYCRRARNHLAALGSPFAIGGAIVAAPAIVPASIAATPEKNPPKLALTSPTAVYAHYRQGTAAASQAFWAAHDARVRAITARIEAKWHRVASR